ncbi:F-box/FBD/LRR-repeat protein [Carex littledalei]|uniref:F-box/FBD/LRR-repeat protein n=1 Tax=Carex littledalei TaxID=544730 RepID=A0A833R3J3_9POAL|nr:F-box/FBD/LRR-repeat protein [Carex littledalei]
MAHGSPDSAMETAEDQTDRLSELPEHVLLHMLSFLPTLVAASTSFLSRRFRHLWETTTTLDLDLSAFRHSTCSAFVDMVDRCLLDRDSLYNLLSLRIDLCDRNLFEGGILTFGYVNILLVRAAELGVRHLSFSHLTHQLDEFLPTILSIASLESLSLCHLSRRAVFPPSFAATGLKSLSLAFDFASFEPTGLNTLLSKLHALENLELQVPTSIDLRSETVKRLKLAIFASCREVGICMPKLEVLDFYEWRCRRTRFRGEIPFLKKADIYFMYPAEESAPAIWQMLKAVGNVEKLYIKIDENHLFNPFHTMVEPGVDPPEFPNLKHLDLEMCFHQSNTEDLTILLRNSPALESLNLVDKTEKERWESDWWCTLPPNAEGFHVGEAKTKLVKRLLREKPTRKRKLMNHFLGAVDSGSVKTRI